MRHYHGNIHTVTFPLSECAAVSIENDAIKESKAKITFQVPFSSASLARHTVGYEGAEQTQVYRNTHHCSAEGKVDHCSIVYE